MEQLVALKTVLRDMLNNTGTQKNIIINNKSENTDNNKGDNTSNDKSDGDTIYIPQKTIPQLQSLQYELEINEYTERTFKCVRYSYDNYKHTYVRTYYEEYINEAGYEPNFNDTIQYISYDNIINEVYRLFIF